MDLPVNKIIQGDWIGGMSQIPDKSVHCCVTSPPYWGQRDYGVEGQLGLEPTVDGHIEKLVVGFRGIRRILRDDGVLWVNYGDKYEGSGGDHKKPHFGLNSKNGLKGVQRTTGDLQQGNLIGLAWRLALALQADGWILRSDTIWAKAVSMCDKYSGSTMPESVNGWRWERCKVRTNEKRDKHNSETITEERGRHCSGHMGDYSTDGIWQDCPGCKKCEKNGGLVLRKGSWRSTRAHEYLFQFAKTNDYFCDMEAVREAHAEPERSGKRESKNPHSGRLDDPQKQQASYVVAERNYNPSGRNLRDVWTINPRGYKGAHYATFPKGLVEPIIKVSTSQKGVCPKCGSQWARVIDKKSSTMNIRVRDVSKNRIKNIDRVATTKEVKSYGQEKEGSTITLGWRPTCDCGVEETVPAIVFDPFMGSGTVAAVAARLDRNYIGCELNKSYIDDQANHRIVEAEIGLSIKEQKRGQKGLFE